MSSTEAMKKICASVGSRCDLGKVSVNELTNIILSDGSIVDYIAEVIAREREDN